MSDKDKLYEVWENIPTDYRMFFLVNQSSELIWELNKSSDAVRLKDFRERLRATLSFADDELHELEVREKLNALLGSDIDEGTANTLTELLGQVRGYLSRFSDDDDTRISA